MTRYGASLAWAESNILAGGTSGCSCEPDSRFYGMKDLARRPSLWPISQCTRDTISAPTIPTQDQGSANAIVHFARDVGLSLRVCALGATLVTLAVMG